MVGKRKGISIVVGLLAIVGKNAMSRHREKRQKELQKRVDETAPLANKDKDLSVADDRVRLTILEDSSVDLTHCQELLMSEDEKNKWKAFFSTLGGETAKTTLATLTSNGLLRCDVPLKDLCRIKDNPNAMRGFVIDDGKILKHASFSEPNLMNLAPLMAFQFMAVVTSQYYQQIITEKLNVIDTKLDNVMKFFLEEDRAKLKRAYNQAIRLNKKNTFDIADKNNALEILGSVEEVREKYKGLLLGIKPLEVGYKWRNKKEAEKKIRLLQESRYFDNLNMVMQTEVLFFSILAIVVKVVKFLGSEDDVKTYSAAMVLDYWNEYVEQFNKIKHDVIKYLELEAENSWINKEAIKEMKKEQFERFCSVKKSMLKLQKQFEYRTVLYFKQEKGELKKYISLSKS